MEPDSNKSKLIVGGVIVLVIIGAIVWLSGSIGGGPTDDDKNSNRGPGADDSLDALGDFYGPWLAALQSTTSDPYIETLYTSSFLTQEVEDYILGAEGNESGLDPVMCQTEVPERYRTKRIFEDENSAQILVISRGIETARQSLVSLTLYEDGWRISNIECKEGESEPEREFSFERDGYLLKTDMEPLNPEYWYLVFEENDMKGHTAPLFFDDSSVCIDRGGEEGPCDPNNFPQAGAATVKGQMSELGVEVKRLYINE